MSHNKAVKQDDFLGRATFPLSAFKMCNLQEGSYFLHPRSGYDKQIKVEKRRKFDLPFQGEIQLRIELLNEVDIMNKEGKVRIYHIITRKAIQRVYGRLHEQARSSRHYYGILAFHKVIP